MVEIKKWTHFGHTLRSYFYKKAAKTRAHHGPQGKHERLENWVATAEGARHPVVVVVEVVGGDDFPHFL